MNFTRSGLIALGCCRLKADYLHVLALFVTCRDLKVQRGAALIARNVQFETVRDPPDTGVELTGLLLKAGSPAASASFVPGAWDEEEDEEDLPGACAALTDCTISGLTYEGGEWEEKEQEGGEWVDVPPPAEDLTGVAAQGNAMLTMRGCTVRHATWGIAAGAGAEVLARHVDDIDGSHFDHRQDGQETGQVWVEPWQEDWVNEPADG